MVKKIKDIVFQSLLKETEWCQNFAMWVYRYVQSSPGNGFNKSFNVHSMDYRVGQPRHRNKGLVYLSISAPDFIPILVIGSSGYMFW